MSIVAKLIIAFIRQHPLRWVLTSVAIICAACMVIWVVSGYDALMKQFGEFSESSLGRYALTVQVIRLPGRPVVIRRPGEDSSVPTSIINALKSDPRVESIDPMWSVRTNVRSAKADADPATTQAIAATTQNARGNPFGRGSVSMMGIDSPQPPFPMLRGDWIDAKNRPEAAEGCLSVAAAKRLKVDVGDFVLAGTMDNPMTVKVIGIVNVPDISSGRGPGSARNPGTGGLYVPMLLAEDIVDHDWEASFACITFKPGADINAFRFQWQPRLADADVPLQFQNAKELEAALDDSATAQNMRMQAYSATGISLLASLFIIFSTLSMGVNERSRQLAVLRAVALTRAQIAMLIFGESLLMAIIGWAGGLAAGWGLLTFLQHSNPDLLGNAMMGKWSLALSGLCAFGGSMLAAIAPAIRATRVRPIDAMAPAAAAGSAGRLSIATLGLGLVFIAINPLLVYVIPQSDDVRYAIYMALGCSTMAIGFMLLAPATVVLTDRIIGPVLARLMGLDPRLLAQQLSSNRWRTVGTSVALTIGLGLFISMQVWGYTMLEPFEPGPWVPDVIIGFPPGGIPPAAAAAVAKMPGVDPNRCLPLAVEQPTLVGDITGSAQRATVTREDNVVMIGIDAARAFTGPTPLLKPDFVAGDPESAVKLMKQGHYCIVPDHFCRETKLGIGGKFKVQLATGGAMFEYTIAGVVRLPGWHWMSKYSGLRMNENRSAAMVFANYDDVANDFQLNRVRFMWMDTTAPIDPPVFAQQVCDVVNPIFADFLPYLTTAPLLSGRPNPYRSGGSPTTVPTGSGGASFASRRGTGSAGGSVPRAQFVPADLPRGVISLILPGTDSSPTVHVATRLAVLERIRAHAADMIWAMSQLPLVTLAVTSIGVLNTVLASVRARRWEMGVLRAVGFSRWTLVRLILAESILVGIVAMILSLSFGTMAGWCGAGISQYVSFFGGLRPSLTIPWQNVSIGLIATLLICLLAALIPAILTGKTDILKLLQAGRSAT